MSDKLPSHKDRAARDLNRTQAQLAYSIIETLLEHARAANDMIALMAQAFDQD
ncbi:MAG: hypothetical protein IRZ19_12440, partial [Pyrinomonas methylaliphatogenes]|nr:hypothetical protein [Pyrinomonas methylaliphatogenes]